MDHDPPLPLQNALLVPELAEVYLLLDNLSAVASKDLPDLSKDPVFAGDTTWVQQICDIRWPPDTAKPQNESLSAARLIRAKDALNGAAWPATGNSIAFTLMLAGGAGTGGARPWWKRLLRPARANEPSDPAFTNPLDRLSSGEPPTRRSLATIAFPTLNHNMPRHRRKYTFLNLFLLFALILTCLLSWDVAAGSALLNRVNSLKTIQGSPSKDQKAPATPVGGSPDGSAATDLAVPLQNLQDWVEANTLLATLVGGWKERPTVSLAGATAAMPPHGALPPSLLAATNVEWAAVFIGVLAGTILPICYGVLGASAAVVRNVVARISASTLMPRDLLLSLVQLALGAVIGACVGLFVTADGNGAAGENGLLGPVHLSGAALCFLAGFGVEGVFRALEALVERVFPAGSTNPAAPDRNPPVGPPPMG